MPWQETLHHKRVHHRATAIAMQMTPIWVSYAKLPKWLRPPRWQRRLANEFGNLSDVGSLVYDTDDEAFSTAEARRYKQLKHG